MQTMISDQPAYIKARLVTGVLAAGILIVAIALFGGSAMAQNTLSVTVASTDTGDVERAQVIPAGTFDTANNNSSGDINISEIDLTVSDFRLFSSISVGGSGTGTLSNTNPTPPTVTFGSTTVFTFSPALKLSPGQGVHWSMNATISGNPAMIERRDVMYASTLPPGSIYILMGLTGISILMMWMRPADRKWKGFTMMLILIAGITLASCGGGGGKKLPTSTQTLPLIKAVDNSNNQIASSGATLPAHMSTITLCSCQL